MNETDIFKTRTSYKNYVLHILFGIIGLPFAGIGLIFLVGVWLTVKSADYRLTNERLFLRRGIIARNVDELELYRVRDVTFTQGLLQRIMGVGNVNVTSTDASTPVLTLRGVGAPEQIKEAIRTASRASRKAEGVRVAEYAH